MNVLMVFFKIIYESRGDVLLARRLETVAEGSSSDAHVEFDLDRKIERDGRTWFRVTGTMNIPYHNMPYNRWFDMERQKVCSRSNGTTGEIPGYHLVVHDGYWFGCSSLGESNVS